MKVPVGDRGGGELSEAKTGQLVPMAERRISVRQWFEAQRGEIAKAAPRHIDPETFMRVALTACVQTPKLLLCSRESLMQSVMQAAQLGLMPDGLLGQAYLIPYGDKAQFQVGYQGLIELALRTDRIAGLVADVVHERDRFEYHREVERDHFIHRPYEGEDEPGAVTHAYCIVRRKDGTAAVTVLPRAKIEKEHRAHSKARADGPWVTHWEAMAKKTAILVALKYEGKSTELARVVNSEERIEAGIALPDPEADKILDAQAVPMKSALDVVTEALGEDKTPAPLVAAVPECAGCGKGIEKPSEAVVDDGKFYHSACLDVLRRAAAKKK
jgi:recombination protein RecT